MPSSALNETKFDPQAHRQELGAFLRRRRESLDPTRLGVLHSGRRRTPGLRREEVAQLADVSTTWYTWLEQGREVKASPATLSAIASALQYSEAETRHLFSLAGLTEPASQKHFCQKLSQANQVILDQLYPMPALIQNARFDILGFNQAYSNLMGIDLDALPEEERNCLFLAFTNREWQSRMRDKDGVQLRLAGSFRAAMAKHQDDPRWQQRLIMMQTVSSDFKRLWDQYEILEIENHAKEFQLPNIGKMLFKQVNWWSAPTNGERMVVYIPDDESTHAKLTQMNAKK